MIDKWQKIPYKDYGRDESGADCWGLVRIIRKELRGDDLSPLLSLSPKEKSEKHAAYIDLTGNGFPESNPKSGAVVFVFFGRMCIHAGIIVPIENRLCVVDTTSKTGVKYEPLESYCNRYKVRIHDTD